MGKPAFWLLLAALAGCKDNLPPACRIAQSTTLAASRLALTRDVTLQRAGNGFVLVGVEGDEVRWASLAMDGTLGTESSLTVPQRALRPEPWFGATAKSAPGDQLIVVYAAPKAGVANQLQVVAITQAAGGPPSAPAVLFDLPAGVDPKIVRLAMGTSQTGQRALLTWGFEGQDASPQFLLLRGDAQPVGPPGPVYRGASPRWSCLSLSPSRTDVAVSVLEAPASGLPTWRAFELKDDGGRGFEVGVGLDVMPLTCVNAAPTPRGYVLAYQNNDGTFFSDFNIEKSVVNADLVAGVLEFGGAAKQPRVACVSPMGSEYSLLFDRPGGGEIWRIDAFGTRQGAAMLLPSTSGQVGPLSAVPGRDAFFATYLDQSASSGTSMANSRNFVRVDCPLAAPSFVADAGVDAEMIDAGK